MPGAPKKFNTFAGVFTPSVLTILGVIMYMRLGWVVAQSGLIAAIAIIVIAHIISVSTGLSISSIATDKKIKTGGIYYMLSRSLGLPIGGAIGITLFVGTALSISLYIIGFCESFLGIEAISDFLGMEISVDNFRILGTIVIIILVILAFISTSLALKTQFFILIAIVLSIVSVVVGMFTGLGGMPETASIAPFREHVPFEVIFAIFFPAVTGFTAGVAMSGDLKNPKKSIPTGTMLSIGVGLLVYVGLAFGLAYFVDRELMLEDNNFMMKIAWFSPFLVAGIWGATLSSALGGILGGPRILQAISQDKITPGIFGKGYGANNEPRNALIFTFVLAEAGILIGELDVIARIVSMFYIAAYGFINLAYTLESWASSDFRPTFKIPVWIGILGFVASIIVMFKIDTLAMFMAFIFLAGIFFILKRKEMSLEFGDVWQSVRASILRTVLHKMDRSGLEERNWKPNIMLFSGGSKSRKHLVSFGKQLSGRQGFISNFDLIERKDEGVFPKHEQAQKPEKEEDIEGVFTRKHTCTNIYDGIETIASTYGFAGVEPNTVLLGWARQSTDPLRFIKMLRKLDDLDLNILMVDYDKKRKFGQYQNIDIWWRGTGHNGNLALTLAKFLLSSPLWRNAKLRLLLVNPVNEERDHIISKAREVLNNMRMHAEIKVLNNQIEQKPFYEIIEAESTYSDLIFMGLPDIMEGSEKDFIRETNQLCQKIGTVVLVKASSRHKNLQIGLIETPTVKTNKMQAVASLQVQIPDLKKSRFERITIAEELALADLHEKQEKAFQLFFSPYLLLFQQMNLEIQRLSGKSLSYLNIKTQQGESEINRSFLRRFHANLLKKISQIISKHSQEELVQFQKYFEEAAALLSSSCTHLPTYFPEKIKFKYDLAELEIKNNDSRFITFEKKIRKTLISKGLWVNGNVLSAELAQQLLPDSYADFMMRTYKRFGFINVQIILESRKAIQEISALFTKAYLTGDDQKTDLASLESKISQIINEQINLIQKSESDFHNYIKAGNIRIFNKLNTNLEGYRPNRKIIESEEPGQTLAKLQALSEIPGLWSKNQSILLNASILEIQITNVKVHLLDLFGNLSTKITALFEHACLSTLESLKNELKRLDNTDEKGLNDFTFELPVISPESTRMQVNELLENVTGKIQFLLKDFPEQSELFENESFDAFDKNQFNDIQTVKVRVFKLIEYIIQRELVEPVQRIIQELPEKTTRFRKEARDIVNLISFSGDDQNPENASINKHVLLKDQNNRLSELLSEAREFHSTLRLIIQERLNTIDNRLNNNSLADKSEAGLQEYIRKQESKRKMQNIDLWNKKIRSGIGHQMNQLWYRQSKGQLLSLRLKEQSGQKGRGIETALALHEKAAPKTEISKSLPYYYQQLFLNQNLYLEEYFVGRRREMAKAHQILKQYKNGFKGGLLISGKANSGKSFFATHFCQQNFNSEHIFFIKPPVGGSVSLYDFRSQIEESFGIKGSPRSIFQQIPANSVVVFDDIELWWEKTNALDEIIQLILKLIDEFSFRTFFVAVCNNTAGQHLSKYMNINDYFLGSINMEPMNAEELHEAIIRRHKSGHLKFVIAGKQEEFFRAWDYARFFSRLFAISGGNIGNSLTQWISSIQKYENNRIFLNPPASLPELQLSDFEYSLYPLLIQFLLHKHADTGKIARLMLVKPGQKEDILQKIRALKRAGILKAVGKNENDDVVYAIDAYIFPLIEHMLSEKEII